MREDRAALYVDKRGNVWKFDAHMPTPHWRHFYTGNNNWSHPGGLSWDLLVKQRGPLTKYVTRAKAGAS